MVQKIIKIGNSLGVTLPKEYIRQTKISAGQEITTKIKDNGVFEIAAKPNKADHLLTSSLSSSYVNRVDKFIKHYRPALVQLAKL